MLWNDRMQPNRLVTKSTWMPDRVLVPDGEHLAGQLDVAVAEEGHHGERQRGVHPVTSVTVDALCSAGGAVRCPLRVLRERKVEA
jgi:hypothetical protein